MHPRFPLPRAYFRSHPIADKGRHRISRHSPWFSIGEIQSHLGVPASTLAFHLRGLVVAGLVEQERQGRVVTCRPNIAALNDTLAFVKENCCAGFVADKRERRKGAAA